MLNALKKNFGLKVLSLALACAAWAYFSLAAAPGTTARFAQSLSVPIVVSGLAPGFQARFSEKTATVVFQVPRTGTGVRTDQVQAVLDVTALTETGYHNVPVKIVGPDVPIESLSPASVTVLLDRIDQRTVPVSLDYTGDRRGIVVDSYAVMPAATTIRGVASDLAGVAAVRVEVPIPTRPQRFDAMIRPVAIDAHGAEMSAVQISPNLVRVRVSFVAASGQQK